MNQTTTRTKEMPSWAELREMILSNAEQMKETRLQMQESNHRMDAIIRETNEQMRETDRKYRELADQFTSTTGHITEGIMRPASVRIFKEAGFDVDRFYCNLCKKDKNIQKAMEVDLLMLNGKLAIVVEIKTECRRKDVDHFLRQLPKFKRLFPEYRNKEVLAAVAALNYDRDAAKYAHEQGLLVITTTDGNLFTLDPFERKSLKRF